MTNAEREHLKSQVQAFMQDPRRIALNTPFHWAVNNINSPILFFENLSFLMDSNSVLYFEGTTIAPEIATFYMRFQVANPALVSSEIIYPKPEIYHIKYSAGVIAEICSFFTRYPKHALFNHIKGYKSDSLIFTFHDAFEGCLRISGNLSEATVMSFCHALKVSYSCEPTRQQPLAEPLKRLLYAMEHPGEVKIRGEYWWERLMRKWKTRVKH